MIAPMLANAGAPPSGDGWGFEFKWDGLRAIITVSPSGIRVTSRGGHDLTSSYPELAVLNELLGDLTAVFDGEIVALDEAGHPDIGVLQQRMNVSRPSVGLQNHTPVHFYAFDLLELDGQPLLAESYEQRRELLTSLDLDGVSPTVRVPPHYTGITGAALLEVAREHGMEGIVAKRLRSRYEPGSRSGSWTKTVLRTTREVVIGGWRTGKGRQLGALMMGAYDDRGELVYLGDVGSGFTEAMLDHLLGCLEDLDQPLSPFASQVDPDGAHWVSPVLVGDVQYRTVSPKGLLRYPAWRGLRNLDKVPAEILVKTF